MTRPHRGEALLDYLNQAGTIPLLTAAEELHLGAIVQEWLQHPEPPPALRRRGTRARNRMVSANLRLVVMVCRRYQNRISSLQLDVLDLIQAGNLGLIRAVERYDPSRGYRLSTYAFWWIDQSARRCISELGRAIRLPTQMIQLAFRAQRLQASSPQRLSLGGLAERLGQDEARVTTALRTLELCSTASLDRSLDGLENGATLLDSIPDPHSPGVSDTYAWLHEQLRGLDPIDQRLLQLRFGSDEGHSLTETAQALGLNRNQVQNAERRSLRRLRRRLTPMLHPQPRPCGAAV
ncbi:sigma-70 family RNA polymerase sigma factor [Vulcanococcus limneticus]|uniref:sigma-70 family RNA polymerase sigma factor n=1 Tax=Vulcanococcus limneticus TaxID=2170428 RepID=UPI00398BBEF0